uniref:ribonuclease H n=1 Tax=Knipowitschia caucasica TaxID=637954 RepID=A0AAV2LWN3_KNICA
MPQGVTNAPSTFQRLMEKCMGELNLKEVLVFIDDLIVFAPTLEEHEERLMKVLNRLKEYGLKLSVEKCMFFQTSVKYLGHVVSQEGVQTDPDKIKTLTTWPVPTNLKELRSFLGFSGYYRRFIEGYSAITKPLHDLTAGYPPAQKSHLSPLPSRLSHLRSLLHSKPASLKSLMDPRQTSLWRIVVNQ